jgi:TonB-linked SusC/RagA family outer membrane protein
VVAQTVTGTITDVDGEPLIGVNLLIKGTSSGTVTDFDGKYELSVPGETTVLVVSYTGYSTQEVTVGSRSIIDVVLAGDTELLDEIVVIGYGVVRKSDLTGSVAKIDGDQLTAIVAGNPTSALQGKLSGVQVENNGGEPGGATNVFVRGVSSLTNSYPLYVIDGTFADNMNFVNPKDIKSIEVLKDASSAAIYGSRAANGVVLVTTKRGGNEGGAPKISLDVRTGVDAPARMLDFLNGDQFSNYRNQLEQNDNTGFTFSNNGVSTDWQDLSLNSGAVQDYGLSVSGGTENSRYYISGNYFDQEGILVGSGFNRANLRANSEFTLGRFKITESLSISQSQTQSNNWFGFDGATAPHLRQNVPENDGGFEAPNFDDHNFGGYNDYALASLEDNQATRRNILGNVKLSYELTEGLTAGLNLGMDYVNTRSFLFSPTYFMSASDATVNRNDENDLNDLRSEAVQTQVEPTLNYDKSFGDSRLNAVLGATAQRQTFGSIGIQGQNTPGNDIRSGRALDPANVLAVLGDNNVSVLQSYFGRVNYSHNNKYLFSATLRRDASSRFAESNRVGYFPSVSLGWNVSSEGFWNADGAINRMKVRAGYGTLGAQNIPDYSFQPTLGITSPTSFGGAVVPGFAQTQLISPDIKWETSKTSNIGVDVGIWNDRLSFTAEYYIKDVSDVLVGVRLPASSGTALPVFQNAAGIQNKGFELDGQYRIVNSNSLKLNFGFNFSTFNSEITALPNPLTGPSISEDATVVNRFIVGEAPGVFFGFETAGVYADQNAIDSDPNISNDGARRSLVSPGDFIRKDQNGDGIIDNDDQIVLGDPTPDFIYGFNFSGKAGNLDFGAFFQGSQGNEIYNVNKFYNIFWADDNKLTDVLNAWTPSNTNTDIPRSTTLDQAENRAPSSFFVEDASYLRLRTLEVGYTLDTGSKDWLGSLRVFVTAQNLLTLTGYSGYNPDISSAQGGRAGNANPLLSRGLDVRAYPLARTFMFGVQAGF